MTPPPTEYSRARLSSPFSISEALAVVPPMSNEIALAMPICRISAWTPTTPAAGPLSMMFIGVSAAALAVVKPPFDCISRSGASTPMRASSAVRADETGKTVNRPPGKDTVSIIDIHDPTKPRILANLPLMNTIIGPPVNLAITPDQHLALVANSLDWVKDGEGWKGVPDTKIYVIELTASPPAHIATVEVGK